MRHIVQRLKEKPEHHRRRVTFAVSGAITALIFIVWVTVIFPSGLASGGVQARETPLRDAESPLETLRSGVASVFKATESLFSDLEKQGQNFNLEAEYEKIREQVESGEIKITPPSP